MPQKRIPLEPGEMYHIWTHANGDENLFRTDENYRFFLKKYTFYIQTVAETFAYCLMPNHLHLMVRIKQEEELLKFLREKKPNTDSNSTLQGFETLGGFSNVISRQFSHLFNSYTQAYNKVYDRKGSLFIPNFKRKQIDSSSYFGTLMAYIHTNPVHHRFTAQPGEWPHSSWFAYVLNKPTKLKKDEAIQWFGGIDNFLRVHNDIRMEKLTAVFES